MNNKSTDIPEFQNPSIPAASPPTIPSFQHSNTPAARLGKIARLPHDIREQVNIRLQNGEFGQPILDWLNSLPEVRSVIAAEFDGQPISPTNLTRWRQGGYRDWLVGRSALDLVAGLHDRLSLDQPDLSGQFATKLAHCAALHYAACAQNVLSPEAKPADTLQFLRQLSADITRLHRPELHAQRLDIERQHLDLERQWLALEQDNSRKKTDTEFWAWTKRADIQEKLHPKDQGGFTDETRQRIEDEFHLFPKNRRKYMRKKCDTPAQFTRKTP
ncbi:MAG: hypothetical protein C5B50_29055 [Verrucomicrobia bacterium]|nr:MAG: hypothetical protein C5B50_29055 [Verrucomicrobiota bacterium]